jgi:type IV secretory pathway VirB4 component
MQSKKLAGAKISQSTQIYLDIAEIKNDTVILKDGSLRAVIMVSSINFALKSEAEQNALVSSYISFLNYMDFPVQIVIQSRKLNIDSYIGYLEESERSLTNDLLKRQIANYKVYIRDLIDLGEIMTKRFYIVIPYSPVESKQMGFFNRLSVVLSPAKVIQLNQDKFLKYLHEIDQRIEHVTMNLGSMGLTSVRLDTQGLIELYYNIYNPSSADVQKLADMRKLRIEEF